MKLLFISHTAMGGPFVVGSHHLAQQLAGMGHLVAHVSTPMTMVHMLMRRGWKRRSARWVREGLFELVPFGLVPWKLGRWGLAFGNLTTWSVPTVRRVLEGAGFSEVDAVVIDQPKLVGLERSVKARHLVYRATDLYFEMSGDPQVADAERRLATRARLLIGTSGPVLEHLVEIAPGRRSLLLENGVDVGHFSAVGGRPKAYEGSQGGVLVYVGALDERFDIATVRAVAEAFPATRIALLGPIEGEVRERFKGAPNVIALGPQPYDQIPAFLGHATIALLPLTSHPANRGRSPMKLYEYAAAGLPVVATRTVELERRNPAFVESAPDQDAFVAAVGRLLADDALRRKRGEDARREAAEHDWAGIAARLASEIERLEGK